jgi:hypothetical protein
MEGLDVLEAAVVGAGVGLEGPVYRLENPKLWGRRRGATGAARPRTHLRPRSRAKSRLAARRSRLWVRPPAPL